MTMYAMDAARLSHAGEGDNADADEQYAPDDREQREQHTPGEAAAEHRIAPSSDGRGDAFDHERQHN
jgi:hypothetical protein